ncbi:MAG: hypothetical protein K8S98_13775 [Planctomycetes bacterium]|nr:hypothetical protein [Planctomycetota bacterium]
MNPSLSLTLLALASTGAAGLGLRQDPAAAPTQPAPSVRSDVDDLFDTDDADDLDEAPEVADTADEADEPDEADEADEIDEVGAEGFGDFSDLASMNGDWGFFAAGGQDDDGDAEWNAQGADELREHQRDFEALREALEEQRQALEESRQAFEESRRGWAESLRAHAELSRELGEQLVRSRDAQVGAQRAKALKLRELITQRGLAGRIAEVPSSPRGMGAARVGRPGTARGGASADRCGRSVRVLGGSGGGSCAPKCESKCDAKCEASCESSSAAPCAPHAQSGPATDATPASPGVVYWNGVDGQGYTMLSGDYGKISEDAYRAAQDALSAADWSQAYAGQVVDKAAIERAVEEARAAGVNAGAYAFDGNGLVSLGDLGGVWTTENGQVAAAGADAAQRMAESAGQIARNAKAMAEREVAVARGHGRSAGRASTTGRAVAVVPDWGTPSGDVAPSSDTMNELTSLIREMSSEVRGLRDDLRSLREDLHRERGGELR